jgi:hypothetical protein
MIPMRPASHMRHPTRSFTMIAIRFMPAIAPVIMQSAQVPGSRDEAAQRPRFRGPGSNPVSENPGLPVSWSKTENVEWVADVPGVGWSSPVVWGNRVFLTAAAEVSCHHP